jgi:hypothetical protein
MKRVVLAVGLLLGACADDDLNPASRRARDENGGEILGAEAPQCPADVGTTYVGFGKTNLTQTRLKASGDRARIKPYEALAGELARVLGNTPASLAGAASALDAPPARWYVEPSANAGSVYTAYAVGFDACLTKTAVDAAYAAAPTAESATAECAAMARKLWSRAATPDELKACVDVATVGSASEPLPRRRWAYVCASLTTAAGFLTY